MLETVKKGQGLVVRRVTFWSLAILIVWGGQSLYTFLINTWEFCKNPVGGGTAQEAEVIPVLNQRMDWAFVISWATVLVGIFVTHALLNRPRTADFLIETDNEVKKVTWPTWKDAWQSSLIVVLFVAMLTGFLLLSDFLLSHGIRAIL